MRYCRLVINIHICDGFIAVLSLNGQRGEIVEYG
jgi:hypothetical protein